MSPVHILNIFDNACGGSEWHAVSLFEELADHVDVTIWTEGNPPADYLGRYPVRRIGGTNFPQGGNLVFLGAYFSVGGWLRKAAPERVIVVYNIVEPTRLFPLLQAFESVEGLPAAEVVFVSDYLRRLTPGVDGPVLHSPIDLPRFSPPSPARQDSRGLASPPNPPPQDKPLGEGGSFTIGKHSRDDPRKHHPEDLGLYESLAAQGVRVRVMGGACLPPPTAPGVEFFAAGTEDPLDFLRTLDVFYFRNDPCLPEAWGRAVMEAMATGLPVVAGREGGYADIIRSGENGFLVDSTEEAEEAILRLRYDPELRRAIGLAGLETVREVYSPEATQRRVEFYSGRRP